IDIESGHDPERSISTSVVEHALRDLELIEIDLAIARALDGEMWNDGVEDIRVGCGAPTCEVNRLRRPHGIMARSLLDHGATKITAELSEYRRITNDHSRCRGA